MKTVFTATTNDTESIRNQRTVNVSYTGFYLFLLTLVSVGVWAASIIIAHV